MFNELIYLLTNSIILPYKSNGQYIVYIIKRAEIENSFSFVYGFNNLKLYS